MTILNIIKQLRATRSKNEKQAILEANKANDDLKEFFRLALDPFILFYAKKDFGHIHEGELKISLKDGMAYLRDNIATRQITGNAALDGLRSVMEQMLSEDVEVMRLILKKDPDCGVDTTALKVWPGLYKEYPVLLSESFDQKYWDKNFANKKLFAVQLKGDGGRTNIIIRNGVVSVMSRVGNELNLHGRFDCLAERFNNIMIDGELVAFKDGKFLSRKQSNGIFTKAIRGTISKDEADMMHLMAWDTVPITVFDGKEESAEYLERFTNLTNLFANYNPTLISIIESRIVSTQEEAMGFYLEMRERGEEGAMIKTLEHKWSNTRSKEILKLKNIATVELKVVGANEGEGVLKGNLGSLILETECGKLNVNCSGFPLKLRSQIWANINNEPVTYSAVVDCDSVYNTVNPGDTTINIGSILEIKYNELINDKRTGKHSLFLPRFDKERLDKTHANTLEEIATKGVK